MITQSINLNLIPGAVPPRIKVSQYDYGSRTLQFTLYNGTTTFTQAGLSARIQGTKPDGKGFSYDATYGSGIVTADITRQMTACAGAVICELVIVDGSNNELGTGNFILDVEAAALSEDTDISETEIPAIIDAAEANAERAEAAAESAEAASAHAPYIGENEHWYVWDSDDEQYVDSGVDAEGVDGVGIVSIAKTGTQGLVDTYTITLSNGNTSTFTVTNGAAAVLPAGGTAGQALIKNSSTASDASWKDISTTGAIKWTQAEGYVGKNLLKNTANTATINGVTFTVASDGKVNVNTGSGTATAHAQIELNANIPLKSGVEYTVTSSQTMTTNLQMSVQAYNGNTYVKHLASLNENGNTKNFTPDYNGYDNIRAFIWVRSGSSISNQLISPMIRLSSIADNTFVPYIPDNTELDAKIDNQCVLNQGNAGFHNSIYRGKNLGTSVSAAQFAAIAAGTFDDMFVGDYWTINSKVYRIAHFDYWLHTGDTECTTHHVVIVPDANMYDAKMNDTKVSDGGYIGSKMYTENLATARTTIQSAFGNDHILSHREFLTNAVTSGKPSNGEWVSSDVVLMNERMVYGNSIFEPKSDGSSIPALYTVDKSQLALFAHDISHASNRAYWWLRDVVSSITFAYSDYRGMASYAGANDSRGVRPAFGIKG